MTPHHLLEASCLRCTHVYIAAEEVQHGDITTGVKCVWGAFKAQSSNWNAKHAEDKYTHSVWGRSGATVFTWLIGWCSFIPQNITMIPCFNSVQNRWMIYYCILYLKGEGCSSITWCYHTSSASDIAARRLDYCTQEAVLFHEGLCAVYICNSVKLSQC